MSLFGPKSTLFNNFNGNNCIYIVKYLDDNESKIIGATFSYETAKHFCGLSCIIESIPILTSTYDIPAKKSNDISYNEWNFGGPNTVKTHDPTIEKTLFLNPNLNINPSDTEWDN